MKNREERVTVRFEENELSEIDALVDELRFKNRSQLLRRAVSDFMRRRRAFRPDQEEAWVPVSADHIAVIDNLVKKNRFISREAALFEMVREYLDGVPWDRVEASAEAMQRAKYENAAADLDDERTARYLRN